MIALTAEWFLIWLECNFTIVGLSAGSVCTAYGVFYVKGRMSDKEGEEDIVLFENEPFSQN